MIAVVAFLLVTQPAVGADFLPPPDGHALAPRAVDHVAAMEVTGPRASGTGPHRLHVVRSGSHVREERRYPDRTETHFFDLGAGTTFWILRDAAGKVRELSVVRARADRRPDHYRRVGTDRYETMAGESCRVWIVRNQSFPGLDYEACETADGVQLWRRAASGRDGGVYRDERLISLERRPVRAEEARPPADFFELAPWWDWALPDEGQTVDYEVRYRLSSGRGNPGEEVVRRRLGNLRSTIRPPGDDGAGSVWMYNGRLSLNLSRDHDGAPWQLTVIRLPFDLHDEQTSLLGRGAESLLGERCVWQEIGLSSTPFYECRTEDEIPLILERGTHWVEGSVHTAYQLSRGRLTYADFAPPADALRWENWGVEPPDCLGGRRVRGPQSCEAERDRHDVLDAAARPPALALGGDAVRFSGQASAGFRGGVVEIVQRSDGRAEGALYLYRGHWRMGWEGRRVRRFSVSAADYRSFAAVVDGALDRYLPPIAFVGPDGSGESIVCTDGPGFLTERIRDGEIMTLGGSCPPAADVEHPNRRVAAAVYGLLCRELDRATAARVDLGDGGDGNPCRGSAARAFGF